LFDRATGDPIVVRDDWDGNWRANTYYPSPEMHVDAASMLERRVSRYVTSRPSAAWKPAGVERYREGSRRLRFWWHRRLSKAAAFLGPRGRRREYKRFIILGEGRSGSNFLRGLLNSHPGILVFGELFRFLDSIGWEFPEYDRFLQTRRLVALSQGDRRFSRTRSGRLRPA
jgi:hypothetical protein